MTEDDFDSVSDRIGREGFRQNEPLKNFPSVKIKFTIYRINFVSFDSSFVLDFLGGGRVHIDPYNPFQLSNIQISLPPRTGRDIYRCASPSVRHIHSGEDASLEVKWISLT